MGLLTDIMFAIVKSQMNPDQKEKLRSAISEFEVARKKVIQRIEEYEQKDATNIEHGEKPQYSHLIKFLKDSINELDKKRGLPLTYRKQ